MRLIFPLLIFIQGCDIMEKPKVAPDHAYVYHKYIDDPTFEWEDESFIEFCKVHKIEPCFSTSPCDEVH